MKAKFSEFDEYQLAKHNKAPAAAPSAEGLDEEEWQAVLRARDFTIKRLVSTKMPNFPSLKLDHKHRYQF